MTAFILAIAIGQSALPRPALAKGQEISYVVNMTFTDVKENDISTKQEWKLSYKGTDRGLAGTRKLLAMQVDGKAIKLDKVESEAWTEVRNPRGGVMARTVANDPDLEKRRWIRLFDISYPAASLRRGSAWTTVDEQDDLPKLTNTLTVDSIDDDYMSLKISAMETGNRGWAFNATARCDKRSGWPRDMRGVIDRFMFPDDEEKRTYRVEYTARQVTK